MGHGWGEWLGGRGCRGDHITHNGSNELGTFVVGVSWGVLSTGGTIVMGTIGAKVVGGPAYVAPGWNIWTGVTSPGAMVIEGGMTCGR